MNTSDIQNLSPQMLWRHFYSLTRVPRPSGKKEQIGQFLADYGKSLGLETIQDAAGNVLVRKPATPGMEIAKVLFCRHTWTWFHRKTQE